MLELNKSHEKSLNGFRGQLEKVLGEQAEVKALKQEIIIECKELDKITSRKEAYVALRERKRNWTESNQED